jgi:hypothetical protein
VSDVTITSPDRKRIPASHALTKIARAIHPVRSIMRHPFDAHSATFIIWFGRVGLSARGSV